MGSELQALRDSARQVVAGLGMGADERSAWQQVAELGWLMVGVPEELGGLGMGLSGACALHRELGRGVAPVPLLPALLSMEALRRSTLPDREERLEQLCAGADYIAAPLGRSELVLEQAPGGKALLNGIVHAVPSADSASHVLLWTGAADQILLLPVTQPGIELCHRQTWDTSRRLFELRLSQVAASDETVIATGAAASELVESLLIWRDFALAAEAVGGAGALLEQTVEYLETRRQFGRPLALFQALKHRCADLKTLFEAADALLQDGLARAAGETAATGFSPAARQAGLAARQLAGEAYARVAEEALQLHGGIGMTAEHDCHRYLKRAMLDEQLGRGVDQYAADLAEGLLA